MKEDDGEETGKFAGGERAPGVYIRYRGIEGVVTADMSAARPYSICSRVPDSSLAVLIHPRSKQKFGVAKRHLAVSSAPKKCRRNTPIHRSPRSANYFSSPAVTGVSASLAYLPLADRILRPLRASEDEADLGSDLRTPLGGLSLPGTSACEILFHQGEQYTLSRMIQPLTDTDIVLTSPIRQISGRPIVSTYRLTSIAPGPSQSLQKK